MGGAGPATFMIRRPPAPGTRRISLSAAGLSSTNWSPSWQSTASNDSSGSGIASALASFQSIAISGGVTDRATASMPGFRSSPPTAPVPPTHFCREPRDDARAAGNIQHTLAWAKRGDVDEAGCVGCPNGRDKESLIVFLPRSRCSLHQNVGWSLVHPFLASLPAHYFSFPHVPASPSIIKGHVRNNKDRK